MAKAGSFALTTLVALLVAALVLGPGGLAVSAETPDARVTIYADSPYGAWHTPGWWGSPNTWDGGEFNIDVVPGTGDLRQVTQVAPSPAHDLATFCVQQNQVFYSGSTYYAKLGADTNHGQNIRLTGAVAWLYHQWNGGDLLGYNYANDLDTSHWDATAQNQTKFDGGRIDGAVDLQEVIWQLMYEECVREGKPWESGGYTLTPRYDPEHRPWQKAWYDMATKSGWRDYDIHGVRVMKLYSGYSGGNLIGDSQDQLMETYVTPEPTSLALLAVGALPVLPLIRRRRCAMRRG